MRVRRKVAQLAALALHPKMRHAPALLVEILDQELGQLFAPERVVQQHRQDGPVPFSFQRVAWRRVEQRARLRVAQRRCPAFARFGLRAPNAAHRVVGDRIGLAQVVIQRSQGGELAPDGGGGEILPFQLGAPGQDVGARDGAKFLGLDNAGEGHEGAQVALVGAPGLAAR